MKAILAIVLLGLLAAFLWERNATNSLLAQNKALRADALEAERLNIENRDLPKLRAATSGTVERSSQTEMLRLRNDVRQLRAQQQEADKLRAANRRLAEEIKSGKFTPRRLAEIEGAVPREKWTFTGFATPEATVQSLLVALASGDPEQILRCVPAHETEWVRKWMTQEPEKFRKEFMGGMDQFRKLTAFRISGVHIEEEKAVVKVQLTADAPPVPLQMYREEGEWKVRH